MSDRYQRGCLRGPRKLKDGSLVWDFYFWEQQTDRRWAKKHRVIKAESQKAAERKSDQLRAKVNDDHVPLLKTFGWLLDKYIAREIESPRSELAPGTRAVYAVVIRKWIRDRWESKAVEGAQAISGQAVEDWLSTLDLANGTKSKLRSLMSAVFAHGQRNNWIPTNFNPLTTVRQSSQREREPDILTAQEAVRIAERLSLRELVLLVMGLGTGLRISELLALKWFDILWSEHMLKVDRSIYHQKINPKCKAKNSKTTSPLDERTESVLKLWRENTPYRAEEDWVFASPVMQGKQPYWPDRLRENLQAVVKGLGIEKRVGWHTLRHTLSTLLRDNKEDVSVHSGLLRNSARVALESYTQAIPESERAAQAKVMDRLFGQNLVSGDGLVLFGTLYEAGKIQ